MPSMIEAQGLVKSYGKTRAVDGLSFLVPEGQVFGFLGQNGSGKTTTMKMLAGITEPDAGTVRVGGAPPAEKKARAKIAFMPEAPYFYERLTGLEFVRFCGELFGGEKKADGWYEAILEKTGLREARHKIIATYSKGMKQRLAFAQIFVNDPDCVLLDEPLDGLDPLGRRAVKGMIKDLRAAGKTVCFNSHILYDIEELCDTIGVIHRGRLLYSGSVQGFCGGRPLEEKFVSLIERIPLPART